MPGDMPLYLLHLHAAETLSPGLTLNAQILAVPRIILALLGPMLIIGSVHGQADAVLGEWESAEKDGRMAFYKHGNTYAARLTWGVQITEADRKTSKKDTKNPDPSLRSRNIVGITYITGLTFRDGQYVGGRIYNPLDGNTYDCKITLENGDVHLRAYMGLPVLGETRVWTRLK
jgi:uncharacterized protein (DUF2147 family)